MRLASRISCRHELLSPVQAPGDSQPTPVTESCPARGDTGRQGLGLEVPGLLRLELLSQDFPILETF